MCEVVRRVEAYSSTLLCSNGRDLQQTYVALLAQFLPRRAAWGRVLLHPIDANKTTRVVSAGSKDSQRGDSLDEISERKTNSWKIRCTLVDPQTTNRPPPDPPTTRNGSKTFRLHITLPTCAFRCLFFTWRVRAAAAAANRNTR